MTNTTKMMNGLSTNIGRWAVATYNMTSIFELFSSEWGNMVVLGEKITT